MNITKIIIEKVNDNKLLANASIIFDYDFVVHDIKLMNGEKGEYVIFPKNEREESIFCPTTNNMRLYILNSLLDAIDKIS